MVHWQNTEVYQFIKTQGSKTYVADQNRLANPDGGQNPLGLTLSQCLISIFSGCLNTIQANQDNGDSEGFSVGDATNYTKKFKKARDKYEAALNDYNSASSDDGKTKAKARAEKYLALMSEYSKNSKTFKDAYDVALGKMPK